MEKLLNLLVILLLIWSQSLFGTDINLTWNPNPPKDNVTSYIIYYGPASGFYTNALQTTTTNACIQANAPKMYFALSAVNANGESAKTPELVWNAVTLELHKSSNLTNWSMFTNIYIQNNSTKEFYRLEIK